ncbi:MAG TPA: hypothetical protein VNN80_22960 [Polyangiaceae bacterium]|nr:hypothetical protein [Polyangiaceae bacterium]
MRADLDILQVVQDVDWVVGSFIASPSGELLVYLMPEEFGEDELGRTASRLASIVRCAELCGLDVDQCDFSFSRYQLVVSRCAAGMLAVLVEAPVSRRALSMAARLVLEELPALTAALSARAAQLGLAARGLAPVPGASPPR